MRTLVLIAWAVFSGAAATGRAAEGDAADFTKRGPLDGHAEYVRQLLDTLELTDDQRGQLDKVVAEGHASWRAWFKENHEKVAAHAAAVRAAKADGDRKRLAAVCKQKKAFMHTAPSLLRHPEPVRAVLTPEQRKLFDERLLKLQRELHRPAEGRKTRPVADSKEAGADDVLSAPPPRPEEGRP